MTAKEIILKKAAKYNDGFTAGQLKWIIEAMEEYAKLSNFDTEIYAELLLIDINDHLDNLNPIKHSNSYLKLKKILNAKRF